jgi:hypothetical protein
MANDGSILEDNDTIANTLMKIKTRLRKMLNPGCALGVYVKIIAMILNLTNLSLILMIERKDAELIVI